MISGNYSYGGYNKSAGLTYEAPHCGINPTGPKTVNMAQTEAMKPNFEQFDRKLK